MQTVPPSKLLYLTSRDQWREWLAENHASENEAWLVMYRKHTGRQSVPYADAVEEALCFGWIDSVVRKVDADSYAQKFSPRKPKSNWAESNKRRVKALIEQGLMTEAGMATITFPLDEDEGP